MSPPEPLMPHLDAAGWALGVLDPDDRTAFELHLRECDGCRREAAALQRPAELLRMAAAVADLPPALRARTLEAVDAAAGAAADEAGTPPRRRDAGRWTARGGLALAGALAALAFAVVVAVEPGEDEEPPLEVAAELRPPGGGGERARVEVVKTGIGRVIDLRTDDLAILPAGQYYEIWFVGPGDSLRRPNRISAGTFHPDEQGRSDVTFAAAVDPKKYPGLSITREPGDGDPRRTGPEVLRGRAGP